MYNPKKTPPKPANVSQQHWNALTTLFGYKQGVAPKKEIPQTEMEAIVQPGKVNRRQQRVGLQGIGSPRRGPYNFGGSGTSMLG